MNLFEKSGQSVGDNSSAIQVSGDAHFGNTTTEVMAICQLMVKSEMASLRQDAFALVDSRAQEFGNQIAAKLSKDVDEKLRAKLADPDIQYTLNQAVVQVARKGFDAKSELLKELIVSKFNTSEEEGNLLLDQALDITPKLTTSEIKLLSLVYYFRFCQKAMEGISITEITSNKVNHPSNSKFTLAFCQNAYKQFYQNPNLDYCKILGDSGTLKPVDASMLSFKGCINSLNSYETDYFSIFRDRTGVKLEDEKAFDENFPALKLILDRFSIKTLADLNGFVLSPIGKIIAINYLKSKNFLQ